MALLVSLIVLAVAGGLYLGYNAGKQRPLAGDTPRKTIGARARETATKGVLGVWRWNRTRKKKARDDPPSQD